MRRCEGRSAQHPPWVGLILRPDSTSPGRKNPAHCPACALPAVPASLRSGGYAKESSGSSSCCYCMPWAPLEDARACPTPLGRGQPCQPALAAQPATPTRTNVHKGIQQHTYTASMHQPLRMHTRGARQPQAAAAAGGTWEWPHTAPMGQQSELQHTPRQPAPGGGPQSIQQPTTHTSHDKHTHTSHAHPPSAGGQSSKGGAAVLPARRALAGLPAAGACSAVVGWWVGWPAHRLHPPGGGVVAGSHALVREDPAPPAQANGYARAAGGRCLA